MSEAASAPRPIAPPSAQEVQRKLGSPPTLSPPALLSSVQSNESQELQRRLSSASRRPHGSFSSIGGASMSGMSSADEDEAPSSSPNRPSIPLSAISEAEDGIASGSDSDASSAGDPRSPSAASRAIEKLRISRESTRLSESVAMKSGYLMKKGERRKAWKKRWFVLRGGQVAMYKNDKEYRLLRLIPLAEIHSCSPIVLKKHAHTFGIVTPQRTYYVEAASDGEVQSWCAAVEQAKHEVAAAATKDSLDGPSRDSLDTTPHASVPPTPGVIEPTPAATPLQSPRTAAIPIPSSSATPVPTVPSNSFATTTSPSPPAAFSHASTSVLSSSATSVSTNGVAAPVVPPNSFVAGGAGALGLQNSNGQGLELALGNLDAGLERIAGTQQLQQGRSPSFSSDAGLTVPSQGYFGRARSGTGGTSGVPTSPGGAMASSSEEDDGFDEAWSPTPQQPTTPGGALTFVDNKPLQQQQATKPVEATGSGFGDPNKVILSGYLMKQGKRKTWRKRWFVLMSGRLMYSRSHMDAKIHRQIPLALILDAIEYDAPAAAQSSNSRRPLSTSGPLSPSLSDNMPSTSQSSASQPTSNTLPSDKNYEHCFKIITPKRTYLVCAPTEEDEIKWLAALQCLVARKNQPQQSQPSSSSAAASPPVLGAPISSPSAAQASGPPPTVRRGSSHAESPNNPRGYHTRQRSVTDAARAAVMDVERRYHPQVQQQQQAATTSSQA